MADLAVINIEVVYDDTPMDKMIKSGIAAEAMVKRLNQAYKDNKITMDEALRGLQEIEVFEKKNSVAMQDSIRLEKESARVAKENSAMLLQQAKAEQAEKDKWFASQRRKLDMMKESQRIDNSQQVKALKEEAADRDRIAAAEKREADQLDYLNMKYDKAYAAAKLYKSVQDEINLAMSKGVGNADQLKNELDKLQAEYAAFGTGTTDIKNRFVQQATAVEESRKGVNKWGLLVQQTGYQAGDFLVQIQSGTNIFVAFGQQATQLVGILPMFATELGVSAVALGGITLGLSIAIPLITAIGAGFMRSSEDTKKAKTALDELDSSLKGIDGTLRTWENTKAAVAAGITVEQLVAQRGLGQAKADQIAAIKELDAAWAASSTRPDVGGESASFTLFGKSSDQKVTEAQTKVEEVTKRLAELQKKINEEQKRSYQEENIALQDNFNKQVVAAQFGSDSAQAMQLDLEQRINSYDREIDKQILSNEYSREQGKILKETNAEFEKKLFAREELTRREEEANGLIADANQKAIYDANQSIMVKRQEAELQRLILEDGKNSNQVYEQKALMAKLAAEQAEREKFAKDGISATEQDLITKAGEQAYIHEKNAGLIEQQTQNAQNLAAAMKDVSSAMKGMFSFGESLDKALDAATVKADLLKKGIDASTAGTISGMQADLDQKMAAVNKAGINPSIISGMFGGPQAKIDELTKLLAANQATEAAGRKHGPSEDSLKNKLEALYKYLDATKEVAKYLVDAENLTYQEREDSLKAALDRKIITVTQYNDLEKDLTIKHQQELANIERMRQTTQIKDAGTFFGGMADLAKAGGDKTAKAVRVFSAAQALTNSYLAFTQILADPSLVGRPWARFGMAASALASGLSAVAAIKGGGGGGISTGSSSSSNKPESVGTTATATPATPLSVMIQGIKPTDIFTGEQLSTLFDSLYKENRNRGMVFQVAR